MCQSISFFLMSNLLYPREIQLDIKQWQLKQVEKQRQVKMSSKDWLDHPDRYLLEMAGRQNYTPS